MISAASLATAALAGGAMGAATARPPRCALVNIATGEEIQCLLNPSQLAEKIEVKWNRLQVPGLSHEILQFANTGNRQYSGVEFYFDKLLARAQPGDIDIMAFRTFLRALTLPIMGAEGVPATAPPRVLLVWPGVVTVECVVASVEFQFRQLATNGEVMVYVATVTFEEILDTRVGSQKQVDTDDPGF